jgi:hypothetical protein
VKRLFAALSLYHNRAVPLTWVLEAAIRTDNLKLKVSPAQKLWPEDKAMLIVRNIALLNPLLPPG